MNQTQIIQLQNFIKVAHIDINTHKECRDHASHRCMLYSYGQVVGAYSMLGDTCHDSDLHAKVQHLVDCVTDAMGLTLHKN